MRKDRFDELTEIIASFIESEYWFKCWENAYNKKFEKKHANSFFKIASRLSYEAEMRIYRLIGE